MIKVATPSIAYATITTSLNGETFNLTFRFNERTLRWKLDLATSEGTSIIRGLTLMEEEILNNHLTLPEFGEGLLIVDTLKFTTEPCGRDNLGFGKPYELLYSTKTELS